MLSDAIPLMRTLADAAREIALKYYRQPFDVEVKADSSPVTLADKQIEERLRDILAHHRPDDAILGEEFSEKTGNSGFTWVIDPIDGTKSFVIGRPSFGTLIALCQGDMPVLGVIDCPATGERWIGGQGHPTTWNGAPVRTRTCSSLNQACTGIYDPAYDGPMGKAWINRLTKASRQSNYHGDCYFYGLLASGFMDVVAEPKMAPHDFLPLVPIVEAAGGLMTDWRGKPLTLRSEGHALAVGDPNLLDQVIGILQSESPLLKAHF